MRRLRLWPLLLMVLAFSDLTWARDTSDKRGLSRISNREDRVALVIGNKDYKVMPFLPLTNPINDARDMKAALGKLGFTVVYRENANSEQMDEAMHEFARRLNRDGVALFYFSGHGIQADGINYLIPVGTRITGKAEAKSRAYDANIALGYMQEAGARVSVVILDACRSGGLQDSRSSQGGLAQMVGGSGSIIAFATAPGETAQDGSGRNGTFTKHLLQYISEPGLSAITALQKVQTAVADETHDEQKPWINFGPLRGQFCFAGCEGEDTLAKPIAPSTVEKASGNEPSIETAKIDPQSIDMASALKMLQQTIKESKESAKSADLSKFAGNWEISIVHLKDASGQSLFYSPIRLRVDNDGKVTGTAGKDSGRRQQEKEVINIVGQVSSPSPATGQMGISYAAADIQLQFDDGTTGQGKLAFTDGLPVVEYINFTHDSFSGRMYALKQ